MYLGPPSKVLSVKNLAEIFTNSSLEIPLAFLSQRQKISDNQLARAPITPNQKGTFEKREKVLYRFGAQDTDTRGHELSYLEDIEFSWDYPAVDMDSVYRPGVDTPLLSSFFDDFQMGSTAANPIIVNDDEDKEISAPTTTTPESERPTEHPRLLRSSLFGT